MDLSQAQKIMGKNFIGPEELKKISSKFKIATPHKIKGSIPKVPFSLDCLNKSRKDYILILGIPQNKYGEKLTINKMRLMFGHNPDKKEPCFYNQDWYLKEKFAGDTTLKFKWYLIRKNVKNGSRGKDLKNIFSSLRGKENFPSAVLTVFVFFAYFFHSKGEMLWQHDFVWCSDKDHNGDRIYTGRYLDPKNINKNGFNVHRHLSINNYYGFNPEIIC